MIPLNATAVGFTGRSGNPILSLVDRGLGGSADRHLRSRRPCALGNPSTLSFGMHKLRSGRRAIAGNPVPLEHAVLVGECSGVDSGAGLVQLEQQLLRTTLTTVDAKFEVEVWGARASGVA